MLLAVLVAAKTDTTLNAETMDTNSVRKPAVAGSFYPSSAKEILSMTKDVENVNEREAIMNRFGYSLKD